MRADVAFTPNGIANPRERVELDPTNRVVVIGTDDGGGLMLSVVPVPGGFDVFIDPMSAEISPDGSRVRVRAWWASGDDE